VIDLRRVCGTVALLILGLSVAIGQTETESPVVEPSSPLQQIRDYLVELEFEKALVAIGSALGNPQLEEAERAELWVLRSETHVAFGDLNAAETDYENILRLRPGFVPDSSLTPRKARERFEKVRERTIGYLTIASTPSTVTYRINGRSVTLDSDGRIPLLAGEHRVGVEQSGFDPHGEVVTVTAGEVLTLEVTLVPNSRTLVIRTESYDVEVLLDGKVVGRTSRSLDGSGIGELLLADVALGEHQIELRKNCHRAIVLSEVLSVDLMEPGPRRLRVERLEPVNATVMFVGAIDGSQLFIDDEEVGRFPLGPVSTCPGERKIEIRLGQNLLWGARSVLPEGPPSNLDVSPRPNLVTAGEARLAPELARMAERFNRRASVSLPTGDLKEAESWSSLPLPVDTALVLAIIPSSQAGERDRWIAYSPILKQVQEFNSVDGWERPMWRVPRWGLRLADDVSTGAPIVVAVTPQSAANEAGLAVGDRLTSIAGMPMANAATAGRALMDADPKSALAVGWQQRLDGAAREARMSVRWSPQIVMNIGSHPADFARAAWAFVDGAGRDENGMSALSNLAVMLEHYEQREQALATWSRVRWEEGRTGIGKGTALYYIGRVHAALGHDEQAATALRGAADSDATFRDDDGPPVAPAARDHLADLGIASR